jgi:hypothetical protein
MRKQQDSLYTTCIKVNAAASLHVDARSDALEWQAFLEQHDTLL